MWNKSLGVPIMECSSLCTVVHFVGKYGVHVATVLQSYSAQKYTSASQAYTPSTTTADREIFILFYTTHDEIKVDHWFCDKINTKVKLFNMQ